MLLSTSLFGSGGNAPLDSFWDWWRCSSLYSLGLAAMLLPPLLGNGVMLLSQIIGTAAMLLLKNPPSTLVCYCLLLTMSTLAAGTPVSGGQGSDSKNANDTKEILRYLDLLTNEDRGTLLETLRGYPDDVKGRAGDTLMKPTSFDDYMQMADARDEEVRSQVYEETKANRFRQRATFAGTFGGGSAAPQLHPGLQLSLVPRSDKSLGDAKVILCKGDRGADPFACKKTRDKIVKALEPKISASNICCILTSVDASKYDIAADALLWQHSLEVITKFCTQYNMLSLIKIKQGVDLAQPHLVAAATLFKDAIKD